MKVYVVTDHCVDSGEYLNYFATKKEAIAFAKDDAIRLATIERVTIPDQFNRENACRLLNGQGFVLEREEILEVDNREK